MMNSCTVKRAWLTDIEQLKGFAIILVVWGHVYDQNFPQWALDLRTFIYEFHMPLFMYLSGYVFVYCNAHVLQNKFISFVSLRAKRLLLPFLIMAAVVILAKLATQPFISVHKPIDSIFQSTLHILIGTEKSPVLFIWYLFVLFVFSVGTALLVSKKGMKISTLFCVSSFIHFLHVVLFYFNITLDFLYFNRILMYYVFFMTGCWACLNKNTWLRFIDRFWIPMIIIFLVIGYSMLKTEWRYLVAGSVGSIALHGLIRNGQESRWAVFEYFGRHAFAIYLMNMLFVGGVQGLLGKFIPTENYALPVIATATVFGLFGPILIKETMKRIYFLWPVAMAME